MSQHEIEYVPPGELNPNGWNPNEVSADNEIKIEEAIRRHGLFKPIVCRRVDGRLEILGGEHRVRVAERMGVETIPIVDLGDISDAQAKEIGLIDNGRYGSDDTMMLASLIEELGSEELIDVLPMEMADVDDIFTAADVDLDDIGFEDDADDTPADSAQPVLPTHQTIKFRVPSSDAHKITDVIERTMRQQSLTDDLAEINAGNALLHLFTHDLKDNSHE